MPVKGAGFVSHDMAVGCGVRSDYGVKRGRGNVRHMERAHIAIALHERKGWVHMARAVPHFGDADLRVFGAYLKALRLIRLEANKDSVSPEEFHRIRHEQGLE